MVTPVLYLILIFAALIGSSYPIAAGISWADIFNVILGLSVIYNFLFGYWKLDKISKYTLIYIGFLTFAGLVNNTIISTQFLNFYRIFISGFLIYVVYNNVITTPKRIRLSCYFFIAYTIIFIVQSKTNLETSMIESILAEQDTSYKNLDFGYGRNNWGFTNLLLIIVSTFICFKSDILKIAKILIICLFPFLIFNIYFSASRFALIGLIIFIIFFRLWLRKPVSYKEILIFVSAIVVLPLIFNKLVSSVDSGFIERREAIFEEKIGRTGEEAVGLRFVSQNVDPMIKFINEEKFDVLLFGDGLTVTHGTLSHVGIATGIIGLIYFLFYNFSLIAYYVKRKEIGWFIAFVILLMLLNDISTNARFIIGVNNMLFMLVIVYLNNRLNIKR